ncbi:MAG: hypothetical protein ACKOIZ_12055, partial [Actinomycetota bacterium]
ACARAQTEPGTDVGDTDHDEREDHAEWWHPRRVPNEAEQIVTDPGNAKGSLADAVERLWRDAINVTTDTSTNGVDDHNVSHEVDDHNVSSSDNK